MEKKLVIISTIVALLGLPFMINPLVSHADNDKVAVCHQTSSATNPWVTQLVNANQLQSHLDNGDFLYYGPVGNNGQPTSAGNQWCVDHAIQPTATPTVAQPTATPTPGVTATPTPTGVQPTATPTPTGVQVTATPTPTATPTETPSGDTHPDGLGCASHPCGQGASGSSVQQGVLGASTMASTGVFEDTAMNIFGSMGILLMTTSSIFYAKKKKALN